MIGLYTAYVTIGNTKPYRNAGDPNFINSQFSILGCNE